VLALTNVIYFVGAPLWVLERTHASTWVVAGLMATGCVAVGLFQVRIGSRVSSLPDSAAIMLRGGLVLALACLPFVLSASVSRVWADVAILTAGALLAYGEMQVAAGSWGMAYGLAPEGRQGAYQGVFGLGLNAATLVGPIGITMLVVYLGRAGWLILGAAFALVGCLTPWTLRWALAHPIRTPQEARP
jgi:MFS family permease